MVSHPQREGENGWFDCLDGGVASVGCQSVPAPKQAPEWSRTCLAALHHQRCGRDFLRVGDVPPKGLRPRQ